MVVSLFGKHWHFSKHVFLSLVIPVYNQENEVKNCLRKIKQTLDNTKLKYELIVVNDGSTDKTLKLLRDAKNSFPNLKIISYQNNKGKGYAVKKGVLETSGEVVIFLDGDLDINSDCIIKYINELADYDLVIASKAHPNSKVDCPILRRLLSRAFNFFVRTLTGIKLRDTQSGLKVTRGDALRKIFEIILVKRYAFDVELLTIANILNLKIKEMPIEMSIRSSFKFKDIAKMFQDVLAISYRLRIKHYYHKQLLLMRQKNIVSQSSTRIKTMLHEKMEIKVNMKKKNVVTLALSIIIIGIIFSPYPGIEAVTILITDLTFSTADPLDFKIIARDPAAIVFPGPETAETLLSSNVIRITTDPGTASEKVAFFDLACNKLSGDSSVIGDCTFNGVVTEPTPGSLYGFSYGNFYGYGYGFFSGIYGYGTIGTGVYGYGLTANVANQDVAGLYTQSFIGLPTSIRIDVLESTEATDFFTSGVSSIVSGFGVGDVITDAITFDTAGTISGGTFQDVVTFEFAQTFEGSTVFSGGFDANIDLDFGTSTNTFDGIVTFDEGAIFGASQTWSDTATITFGTATDDVISFTGVQDFGISTNTFAGNVDFNDDTTFGAAQTWTGDITFGDSAADAVTFTAEQDFSTGTITFNADTTFVAGTEWTDGQAFDGDVTFTTLDTATLEGEFLVFNAEATFPTGSTILDVEFSSTSTFDETNMLATTLTFDSGVEFAADITFPGTDDGSAITLKPGIIFTGTPTIEDGVTVEAGLDLSGATIETGVDLPAVTVIDAGVIKTAVDCNAGCTNADVLAPGAFLLPGEQLLNIKLSVDSDDTTVASTGLGISGSFTVISPGTIDFDIVNPTLVPSSSAGAITGQRSISISGFDSFNTVGSIYSISEDPGTDVSDSFTITLPYSDANLGGLDENSLGIIHLNDATNVWQQETVTNRDTINNKITASVTSGFSHFGVGGGSPTPTPTPTPTPGPIGGGGGGGGGGGTVTGFGGIIAAVLKVNEVSYDVCNQNMTKIIISTDGSTMPIVRVTGIASGTNKAVLAEDQPFAEQNAFSRIKVYVFEAPLSPADTTIIITVEEPRGRIGLSAQAVITIDRCEDTITLIPVPIFGEAELFRALPKIYDVKISGAYGDPVRAEDITTQFVGVNQTLTVSAILDTPTPLDRPELRVIIVGEPLDTYAAVRMGSKQLPIAQAYEIYATIPDWFMQEPGITFWIHVTNEAGLEGESEKYSIGVKPDGPVNARIELDTIESKASGTTYRSTAYVTNPSEDPLFGTVSLLVDGQTAYTSGQLLEPGESIVKLEWLIPREKELTSYDISVRLDVYGRTFETESTKLFTYSRTQSPSLSDLGPIRLITDDQGNEIARASLLYSSYRADGINFRVVAPDGTCVIGISGECLVSKPTFEFRGGLKSVTIGDQLFRVRYSGADNPLERFSITSIDPIVGQWIVELESEEDLVPQVYAMEEAVLKIKYRNGLGPIITIPSK